MQAQQATMEEVLSPTSSSPETARSAYIQEMNEEYSEDELALAETTTNNQIEDIKARKEAALKETALELMKVPI